MTLVKTFFALVGVMALAGPAFAQQASETPPSQQAQISTLTQEVTGLMQEVTLLNERLYDAQQLITSLKAQLPAKAKK